MSLAKITINEYSILGDWGSRHGKMHRQGTLWGFVYFPHFAHRMRLETMLAFFDITVYISHDENANAQILFL